MSEELYILHAHPVESSIRKGPEFSFDLHLATWSSQASTAASLLLELVPQLA